MDAAGRTGIRLIGVVVTGLCGLLLAALLLGFLGRSRGTGRVAACAENLRQIKIAFDNYAREYGGATPPGNANILAVIVPFRDSGQDFSLYPHCPDDRPSRKDADGTSYAFNCTTFLTSAQYVANRDRAPFTTFPAQFDGDAQAGDAKYYFDSAPDTLLIVEYWGADKYHGGAGGEYSRLVLTNPRKPPKHALRAPVGADDPWAVTDAAHYAAADTDRIRAPDDNVHEWLANFGGRRFTEAFHGGTLNVLLVGGGVEALDVRKLATKPPSAEPRWTSTCD